MSLTSLFYHALKFKYQPQLYKGQSKFFLSQIERHTLDSPCKVFVTPSKNCISLCSVSTAWRWNFTASQQLAIVFKWVWRVFGKVSVGHRQNYTAANVSILCIIFSCSQWKFGTSGLFTETYSSLKHTCMPTHN
jgi:hypothetical protein